MSKGYDFAGWASKSNIRCTDGRVIQHDAFKDMDGKRVPLVYMHNHKDVEQVIGHCDLESRDGGLWAKGSFNGSEKAQHAKDVIQHGDITALSIYADNLRENNGRVFHGIVKEVSLVLAGANSGATIEYPIIQHSDGSWEQDFEATEAVISMDSESEHIYLGEELDGTLAHADEEPEEKKETDTPKKGKSLEEIVNGLPEDEKNVVLAAFAYLSQNGGDAGDDNDDDADDGEEMKHSDMEEDDMSYNVFDAQSRASGGTTLSHADFMDLQKNTFADAPRMGSLKDSFIAHAAEYGIESIDLLFPEAKQINGTTPEFINYDQEWVKVILDGVKHSPISRIKMVYADITEEEVRARGYVKGDRKLEQVFGMFRRSVAPCRIYVKQAMDKDDIEDIVDFDVVSWIKNGVMKPKLREEIARAILFSDGRSTISRDKIKEDCIIPIVKEDDLFCIKKTVTAGQTDDDTAKNVIRAAIKAQDDYEGSGNLTMFMPQTLISDMLLLEDGIGHPLYDSKAKLATKMLVDRIVPVPKQIWPNNLYGVIVNLGDYTLGNDKNRGTTMFEDFDIDYNKEKYLMETKLSGALTKPYSAIVLKKPA